MTTPMNELGSIGIEHWAGRISEEWNATIAGRESQIYREMLDNSALLGGWFALFEWIMGQVDLRVDAGRDTPSAQKERDRIEESLGDMRTPVRTLLGEAASGIPFGFALWELCYKMRRGPNDDPRLDSKYADGRVGWADWAFRSQETIEEWDFDAHDEWTAARQTIPQTFRTIQIPRPKLIHVTPRAWKRSPAGRAALRSAVRAYQMMKGHEEQEAIGASKNLAGALWANVPMEAFTAGTTAAAVKREIEIGIAKFRAGEYAALTFPAETDSNGASTGYKLNQFAISRGYPSDNIIRRYRTEMLIAVLGDTLTTGKDETGSRALKTTEKDILTFALGAVISKACDQFTRAAAQLSTLNGVGPEDHAVIAPDDLTTPELTHIANYVGQILGIDPSRLNDELRTYLERYARLPAGSFAAPEEPEEPAPAVVMPPPPPVEDEDPAPPEESEDEDEDEDEGSE